MAKCETEPSHGTLATKRIISFLLAMTAATILLTGRLLHSQTTEEIESHRKLITRVEPDYPDTLKRLYIGGVVRVQTTIAPNGTVEDAELLGGNPVLGQSAMRAIKQWRYAPTNSKEKLIVKL